MRRTAAVALSALAALLLTAPSALAAQRWTTPTATLASGACAASAPCRIDVAVNAASAGDEVIVAPGVYHVAAQLSPVAPIDLHGVAGQRRPRIVGSSALTSAVLSFKQGGTVRHLYVEATGAGSDAITLQHGVGEDLLLRSAAGDGGKIVTSAAGTVLRDSAVRTNATGDAAALKLRESSGAGTVSLRNVTLMAPSAYGVRCEVRNGQASIVNAIVRGSSHDIEAGKAPGHCTVANSNFRAALSPGIVAGAGNQEAEPVFVDAPKGNYRPAAGSPTVDAGASDALLGTADPAGCARTLGAGPDIGVYEYADPLRGGCAAAPAEELADATPVRPKPPAPEPTAEDIVKGIPAPVIGDTVVVAPGQGSVLVRRPGTTRFRKLDTGKTIPVGSTVDAREGRVHLVSAIDAHGTLQKGTFWGSKFQIGQTRSGKGMTELALRGGGFDACRRASATASRSTATISRKRRPRRSLWAKDSHGRFRTHGRNSAATARGTKWLTVDRCDGTVTRVVAGSVAVRDRRRHKTVVVRAGHSYLARAAR